MKNHLITAAAVIAALALTACEDIDPPAKATKTPATARPAATAEPEAAPDDGVSKGYGSQDATGDIGYATMTPPNSIGYATIEIPVTNHSSGRSDYWIDLVIETSDGSRQLDTAWAMVDDLEPGQSTVAEAMIFDADTLPADARWRLTKVQRTAS